MSLLLPLLLLVEEGEEEPGGPPVGPQSILANSIPTAESFGIPTLVVDEPPPVPSMPWVPFVVPGTSMVVVPNSTIILLTTDDPARGPSVNGMMFFIKRDDHKEPLRAQIHNPDGSPKNITGMDLQFVMKGSSGIKVDAPGTIVDPLHGLVEYLWVGSDTDTAGDYRAEFILDNTDTYPKETYITVRILPDLD